jgi:hypothetical protein
MWPWISFGVAWLRDSDQASVHISIYTHADTLNTSAIMQNDIDLFARATCDVGRGEDVSFASNDNATSLCIVVLKIHCDQIDLPRNFGLLLFERDQFCLVARFIATQNSTESWFQFDRSDSVGFWGLGELGLRQ